RPLFAGFFAEAFFADDAFLFAPVVFLAADFLADFFLADGLFALDFFAFFGRALRPETFLVFFFLRDAIRRSPSRPSAVARERCRTGMLSEGNGTGVMECAMRRRDVVIV